MFIHSYAMPPAHNESCTAKCKCDHYQNYFFPPQSNLHKFLDYYRLQSPSPQVCR